MPIPRLIHVVWVGTDPFPRRYRRYLSSWSVHNPGWRVELWTDTNRPRLANERVYRRMAVPAMRADVLRLELLAKYGGLYSDADSECLRPLDGLLEGAEAVGMTNGRGNVCVATLGALPQHPAFVTLAAGVTGRVERLAARPRNARTGWSIHRWVGTRYVTPVLYADPSYRALPKHLVVARPGVVADTYIAHDHDRSWATPSGGRRVRL